MERVQVFRADTTQAVKSLRELQKELSEIKNRMAELDSGSSEFQKLSDRAGEITSNINDINLDRLVQNLPFLCYNFVDVKEGLPYGND